jgi:protoporphyrinogen oxidase
MEGLNALVHRMAAQCQVVYGKHVARVDTQHKLVSFADGSETRYETLISTLPLNSMMEMTGLKVESQTDPYTSVLVLNIGATRGPRSPDDQWLYIPDAQSGFHRVGFYSNVDVSFLPASSRASNERISIYVERAYLGGIRPTAKEVDIYSQKVVQELQEWGFIEQVEVLDPTWIDVAYTWAWPGSKWTSQALRALEEQSIYQVGRYGRWVFQGIADSIRDGFIVGAAFR